MKELSLPVESADLLIYVFSLRILLLAFLFERIKKSGLHSIEDLAITAGSVAVSGETPPGLINELHKATIAYGVHVTQKSTL